MIAVEGNLRTRTYDDKNGTKHYVTEVYVDNVSFTGEKAENENQNSSVQPSQPNNTSSSDDLSIDEDFEVISDDGVPI